MLSLSNGSLAPGTVIDDKFRIEKVLGEGAVGVVVRALHLKLGTPVALKFLLPRMLGDAVVVERFAREARAAARLTSEHVARVLDVGNVPNGGAPYMVMEYLSGETLSDAMKRRRTIPVGESCSYMMQVCDALTEAHSLGIIHRDLKPANLFLATRPNGKTVVKVLDFGISKMDDLTGTEDSELTMASSILGTPLYMSPEQISSSRTVDGRADLWSCGIVLHRMLSGIVPFDAGSLVELGAKLIKEKPARLDQLRADIPTELANIVLKCLERDVTRRWQSASDLANALSRFAISTASGANPAVVDEEVEPTLAIAIKAARDLPKNADQAETLTIISGTARTQIATPPPGMPAVKPATASAPPPLPAAATNKPALRLEPPPAPPQREVVDVTLDAIPPQSQPPPVLGVRRRQAPTGPIHPSEMMDDEGVGDMTRVARPMQPPHSASYPPDPNSMSPYGGASSRNAPTVQSGDRPKLGQLTDFFDDIEKHPYFGVGMVFLLALLIAVAVLFAFQNGCFGSSSPASH